MNPYFYSRDQLIFIYKASRNHFDRILSAFDEELYEIASEGCSRMTPSRIVAYIINNEIEWFSQMGYLQPAQYEKIPFAERATLLNKNRDDILRILKGLEDEFPPVLPPTPDGGPPSPAWAALRISQKCLYYSGALDAIRCFQGVNDPLEGDPYSWERAADSYYSY